MIQPQPHQLHASQPPVNNLAAQQDEIDLMLLFRSLLKTWKVWFLSLVLVSSVFGVVKAYQILFVVNEASYSKPIRLTFPNAQKLVFPSGAKFAYSDIVAPAVVQLAFERNKIGDYKLTIADLQGGLSAIPYAPTYPLIVKKYEKLMGDKKLTADQIGDLQARMNEEIAQATSGEALITLRLDKKELPQDVAQRVLSDIPAIWAERALKDKGVLGVNVQLASVNSLNTSLINQVDGLVAGDLLNEKLSLLTQNIQAMSTYEGSQSITDPVTGMKLKDLSYAVDDLGRYVIGGLMAPLRLLGLSHDIASASYYYEDKVNRLKISLAALQRESMVLQDVYNSYLQYERSPAQQGNETKGSSPVVMPQLSADMLDKLVSLSGDVAREKYKQQLNDKRLQLMKYIADTESAIADAQLIRSGLQKNSSVAGKLSSTDEQYLAKLKTDLPSVLAQMSSFFAVSDRIYRQLSIESVGIKDQLYIPVTNSILYKKTIIDIKSTLLIWLALMFLTTIIVVPVCMIRNAIKTRDLAE